jgi:hypothetical protein
MDNGWFVLLRRDDGGRHQVPLVNRSKMYTISSGK